MGQGWGAEPLTGECHFLSRSQRLRVAEDGRRGGFGQGAATQAPAAGLPGRREPRGAGMGDFSAVTPSPWAPSQGRHRLGGRPTPRSQAVAAPAAPFPGLDGRDLGVQTHGGHESQRLRGSLSTSLPARGLFLSRLGSVRHQVVSPHPPAPPPAALCAPPPVGASPPPSVLTAPGGSACWASQVPWPREHRDPQEQRFPAVAEPQGHATDRGDHRA